MIDKKNSFPIDYCEVRDQMLWRRGWLCNSEQFGTRSDPCECISAVLSFESVERFDGFEFFSYVIAHVGST